MLLVIDNYDSFTYNLVQRLGEIGVKSVVCRNDCIDADEITRLAPSHIVISPGPCTPAESGCSVDVVRRFAGKIPILGVCLGHQCIAEAFGGRVVRAGRLMHGKTSPVEHDGRGVYRDVPNPFTAMRYHSLIVEREDLPECLRETAWTPQGELMGVRHAEFAVEGVQFHPESFMTLDGMRLLRNFTGA